MHDGRVFSLGGGRLGPNRISFCLTQPSRAGPLPRSVLPPKVSRATVVACSGD